MLYSPTWRQKVYIRCSPIPAIVCSSRWRTRFPTSPPRVDSDGSQVVLAQLGRFRDTEPMVSYPRTEKRLGFSSSLRFRLIDNQSVVIRFGHFNKKGAIRKVDVTPTYQE